MPIDRIEAALAEQLAGLDRAGRRKGAENVTTAVAASRRRARAAHPDRRRRRAILSAHELERLSRDGASPEVIAAEEAALRKFGVGPASGPLHQRHLRSARRARAAARLLPRPRGGDGLQLGLRDRDGSPAIAHHDETAVISDELNHNCIINAIRLAGPTDEVRVSASRPDRARELRSRVPPGGAGARSW